MKKIKKVLLSLSIVLWCANNAYATTTGEYMAASNDTDSGKLILLLIAIGLVAIVLFLGYKLDQSDAQEKRKEQITRKNKSKVEKPDYNTYTVNQENEYSEEDELEYEKEYKKLSEETAVMQTLYSNDDEEIENVVEIVEEVKKEIIPKETYKVDEDLSESSSESTMVIDTSAIKEMIDDEESILPIDTVNKAEDVVEEKPKKAKATTKKTAETKTKKTTTKKVAKKVEKEAEEKPKKAKTTTKKAAETVAKKTTTKKTTKKVEKEVEEKPKTAKKVATKKTTETKAKTAKKTTDKK